MGIIKRSKSSIGDYLIVLGFIIKTLIIPLGSFLAILQLVMIPGGLTSSGLRYWINFFGGIKQISGQQLSEVQTLEWSTPVHIKTQLRLTQKVDSRAYDVLRRGIKLYTETTDLIASDVGNKVLLVQRTHRRDPATVIPNVLPPKPLELNTPVNVVGVLEPIAMDDEFYRRASIKMEVETGKSVLPFILKDYNGDESQYNGPGYGTLFLLIPVTVIYVYFWRIFFLLPILIFNQSSRVQAESDVNSESTRHYRE